ncbi:MAG: hypothetical protein V3R81_08565 [Gammaproteobacteria bacterium]
MRSLGTAVVAHRAAERLGINLKWLLTYRFIESNKHARPAM